MGRQMYFYERKKEKGHLVRYYMTHHTLATCTRLALQNGRRAIMNNHMGRQMYFFYLEWLFVYDQNNVGYLQITKTEIWLFSK